LQFSSRTFLSGVQSVGWINGGDGDEKSAFQVEKPEESHTGWFYPTAVFKNDQTDAAVLSESTPPHFPSNQQ
jgi:hypothetical protein